MKYYNAHPRMSAADVRKRLDGDEQIIRPVPRDMEAGYTKGKAMTDDHGFPSSTRVRVRVSFPLDVRLRDILPGNYKTLYWCKWYPELAEWDIYEDEGYVGFDVVVKAEHLERLREDIESAGGTATVIT